MGWTFYNAGGRTASQLLTIEFTQPGTRADGTLQTQFDVVDQATRGREWYAVIKTTNPDGYVRHFGLVCLWSMRDGEFGFKDMSEDCGPNASRAPLRIVDALEKLAPISADPEGMGAKWARAWRDRCKANATKPKREYHKGMRVEYGDAVYVLQSPAGPRRGWHVTLEGHAMQYRMRAAQLSRAQIV